MDEDVARVLAGTGGDPDKIRENVSGWNITPLRAGGGGKGEVKHGMKRRALVGRGEG